MSVNDGAGAPGGDHELRREGERIAQLIDDLGIIAGAPVRQRVEELVSRLVHLYGTGLASLMRILGGDRGERLDDAARTRLRDDVLVSSLLLLHGIHPDPDGARELDPGPTRVAAAPAPASGLVQIDLGRSRAGKAGGEP